MYLLRNYDVVPLFISTVLINKFKYNIYKKNGRFFCVFYQA